MTATVRPHRQHSRRIIRTVLRQKMTTDDSSNLNTSQSDRLRFRISDMLVLTSLTAIWLVAIRTGQEFRHIWLIQLGTMLIGTTPWWLAIRHPSLVRLHWFCIFASWWVPVSWFFTYVIWQSAFGRDFWIPQIMMISDVGHFLSRFVLIPLFVIVMIIGAIGARHRTRWRTISRTLLGAVPLTALTILETMGLVRS